MKYTIDIRNVDTGELHTITVEGKDAQSTHKHVFMNTLENDEEVIRMLDADGAIVFEENRGFI